MTQVALQALQPRPHLSPCEDETSRTVTPRPPHITDLGDEDYDSEVDRSTYDRTSQQSWPRIGPNYQVDLEALEATEDAEDNAELLWDPDMMSEEELDRLMAHCQVSYPSSTQRSAVHSGIVAPCSSPACVFPMSQASISASPSSESISSVVSSSTRTTEPTITWNSPNGVLPLERMLALIHECHYDSSLVMSELRRSHLDGWSSRQTMFDWSTSPSCSFVPWKREEIDRFELAMTQTPKLFDKIAPIVQTRSIAECIVFYFSWKHTPRYRLWIHQGLEDDLEDCDDLHLSKSLGISSSSRQLKKRKRDDTPLDPAERFFLEALGSLEHPEAMLNIMLDTPSILAVDDDDKFNSPDHDDNYSPTMTQEEFIEQLLPSPHSHHSDETDNHNDEQDVDDDERSSHHNHTYELANSDASETTTDFADSPSPPRPSGAHSPTHHHDFSTSYQSPRHFPSHHTHHLLIEGSGKKSADFTPSSPTRSLLLAHASPKRPKLSEPDDDTLHHAVMDLPHIHDEEDLSHLSQTQTHGSNTLNSSNNSNTTSITNIVDPSSIFAAPQTDF